MDVRPIETVDAKAIVLPNHYSGTWNAAFGRAGNFGVFMDDELVGAAVYGHLMNPLSYKSIANVDKGQVIELNRLWIDDRLGKNTESQVLSQSLKWYRRNTKVQIVQSYADGRLGCGTIYKATNFRYYGKSSALFFRNIETERTFFGGEFSNTARASRMLDGNELLVDGKLEAFTAYSYRYLYLLTNAAKRNVKLKEQPFPRYSKGMDIMPDYLPPLSQMARCVVLCDYREDERYAKFSDYLHGECDKAEYDRLIEEARANKTIQRDFGTR